MTLPSFLVAPLVSMLVPSVAGFLTTTIFDWIDDALKVTASWPANVKRLVVALLATVIVTLNAQYGLHLPTDPSLITQPEVQACLAALIAFFIKHAPSSTTAAPAAAK